MPRPRLQFPSRSLPPPRPSHSCPLGPHTDQFSLKGRSIWLGRVPSPLPPRTRAKDFNKATRKAISLYFSFLPFNQFAEAEWMLEGKEGHLGADPPRNSLCALPRLVSFEKQFNNKLYRIRNVQKCQGGYWLVSCRPLGARVTPISPVQRSWGWRGAPDSSPGEDRPAHPAEVCPGAGTRGCAQAPRPPQAPWLSRRSTSCLYVRPLKVFMQV